MIMSLLASEKGCPPPLVLWSLLGGEGREEWFITSPTLESSVLYRPTSNYLMPKR